MRNLEVLATAESGSNQVTITFVNTSRDTTFNGIVLTDAEWLLITDDRGNQYIPDPFSLGFKGHVTVGPSVRLSRTVGLETPIASDVKELRISLRHVTAKKQEEIYADFLPDIVVVLRSRGEKP